MAHLTIVDLEAWLANPIKLYNGYAYVETGKYKPFAEATVTAAKKRGYVVEKKCKGVYYVYPKIFLSPSYRAGYAAFKTGIPCPHIQDTGEYYDWFEGWDDAESEHMDSNHE